MASSSADPSPRPATSSLRPGRCRPACRSRWRQPASTGRASSAWRWPHGRPSGCPARWNTAPPWPVRAWPSPAPARARARTSPACTSGARPTACRPDRRWRCARPVARSSGCPAWSSSERNRRWPSLARRRSTKAAGRSAPAPALALARPARASRLSPTRGPSSENCKEASLGVFRRDWLESSHRFRDAMLSEIWGAGLAHHQPRPKVTAWLHRDTQIPGFTSFNVGSSSGTVGGPAVLPRAVGVCPDMPRRHGGHPFKPSLRHWVKASPFDGQTEILRSQVHAVQCIADEELIHCVA